MINDHIQWGEIYTSFYRFSKIKNDMKENYSTIRAARHVVYY